MKVAVITTSRADWNSLGMVAKALLAAGADMRVLASSDHPAVETIRADGCAKDGRAYDLFDNPVKALTEALERFEPDMALVCGDRHETLLAAYWAAMAGIPLAHLAGGDVTTGSMDERWRHAITKMADLHFPTSWESASRIAQMGESQQSIHMLGSASVDRMLATPIMPLAETTKALGLPDSRPFLLLNWQAGLNTAKELPPLMDALRSQPMPVVFLGLNPERGAREEEFFIVSGARPGWPRHPNLRPELYLSALAHCHALVGNSSSGFYEAPYYGTPVFNVGTRQNGRTRPWCVLDIGTGPHGMLHLRQALPRAHRFDRQYPHGDGHAAPAIAKAILAYQPQPKVFYDRP